MLQNMLSSLLISFLSNSVLQPKNGFLGSLGKKVGHVVQKLYNLKRVLSTKSFAKQLSFMKQF